MKKTSGSWNEHLWPEGKNVSEELKDEPEREVRQPEGLSFGWLFGSERQIVDKVIMECREKMF